MEKIPKEWVDRLFELMTEYFQERWTDQFKGRDLDSYKLLWQNGLMGLNKEEIKSGLFVARSIARTNELPLTVIDFFHYSKGIKQPPRVIKKEETFRNTQLAKESIATLKQITKGISC